MDIYHIWCNPKPGVRDMELVEGLQSYLGSLKAAGRISGYRITRCKLGLRPPQLREFHITVEFEDLRQIQTAFDAVAAREDPIEGLHHAVNAKVQDVFFALYRDFPDSVRVRGQERF